MFMNDDRLMIARGVFMDSKTLGTVQLVGAVIAGWIGYQNMRWDSIVLALVFVISAIHHYMEKSH